MHFKETDVWNRAMEAAIGVYRLTKLLPRQEVYGMRSQLTRAAVSIPSNIAEGWTRESARDKAHFLAIAHGSTSEVETQLMLCERLGWFPVHATLPVHASLDEVSRMLTALRRRLRR